jgi:hypothetical protein
VRAKTSRKREQREQESQEYGRSTVWKSQDFERKKRAIDERLASDKLESKRIANQRESTVREFELDSGVIPTVKSEINKESERLIG